MYQRVYQKHHEEAPERTFEAGERFPFLGEEHELVVESQQSHAVSDQTIHLREYCRTVVTQAGVTELLPQLGTSALRRAC